MAPPPGQHDYSAIYLTRHALERFAERFGGDPEPSLRVALARTRKLGTNTANGALAVMALHGDRPLVAILQDDACITVLTWPQFEPKLVEFGRAHPPRKWGRWLGRLKPGHDSSGGA
ncbi:hypothetical protein EP7_005344 [Isosphaeraceae bacterium EP7]